jgi:hypothetical protein
MQWIIDKGYVDVPADGMQEWFATRYDVPKKGLAADCQYIINELTDNRWISWSERYPERAARFWPLFATIARRGHVYREDRFLYAGIDKASELLSVIAGFRLQKEQTEEEFSAILRKYENASE